MLCLSLLTRPWPLENIGLSVVKAFQDLSVLVAEVETGGLVDQNDPNYAVLSKATSTIKTILSRTLLGQPSTQTLPQPDGNLSHNPDALPDTEDWAPWTNLNSWDFEMEFWTSLAGHPELSTTGYLMNDLNQHDILSNLNHTVEQPNQQT